MHPFYPILNSICEFLQGQRDGERNSKKDTKNQTEENTYHHGGGDGVLHVHAGQRVGVQHSAILVVHANITLL